MSNISTLMGTQKLLPIIQVENEQDGVSIAQAMYAANLTTVEVVLRSARSPHTITAIKEVLPEMQVCAGTVLDKASLQTAIHAGADFIVTPTVSERLLTELAQCSLPVLPGVASVSDVLLAKEFGYAEMKLFPASLAGGAAFLKAVSSLFPTVKFCPTGGVSQANFAEYLALPNVFAAGGTWVANPSWVAAQEWAKITEACAAASEAA